jgi:uncharacterized membrane protein YdbT with pleckstrin-like domain
MEEKIILKFHPTRLSYIKLYFLGLLFILLSLFGYFGYFGFFGLTIPNIYFLLGVFLGIILILIAEVSRLFSTYTITDQRIIERYGILSKHEDSVTWDKISTLSLQQTFLERLINIGDIELWSIGGTEEPEITLMNVPNIKRVTMLIDSLIKKKTSSTEKVEKPLVEKVEKIKEMVKPKLRVEEIEDVANKYLKRSKISIISILFSQFLSDQEIWQVLLYTNKGYYMLEVNDEGKVVGFIRLSGEEAEELKKKYLEKI